MKNEIKEILELLKEDLYTPQEDNREYKLLDKGDDKLLLDYITNLQEEYQTELDENLKLSEWLVKKQKIIEKAREYINKHLYMESTCGIQHPTFDGKPSYDFDCFELENILNGDDE